MTTQPTPTATAPSAEPVGITFTKESWKAFEYWVTERDLDVEGISEAFFAAWQKLEVVSPTDLRAELSAMTAERDQYKSAFAQTDQALGDALAVSYKWQTAHADTLAELRKVSEELGALKGERAEMAEQASRFEWLLREASYGLEDGIPVQLIVTHNNDMEICRYIDAAITAQEKPCS